jgi:DNA-binding MarR family transcriptional regulator
MERRAERELEILRAIDEGEPLTQRALAARLGVAVGLTNLYLRRMMRKGYVKVVDFRRKPSMRKRLRYLLTPHGLTQKSRLTCEYMVHSLALYRRARSMLRESLGALGGDGRRIALYGTDDAAELAYLTLHELGLEPVAVFDERGGERFLGTHVRGVSELAASDIDAVIVATFESPARRAARLQELGVPAGKIVTLGVASGAKEPIP